MTQIIYYVILGPTLLVSIFLHKHFKHNSLNLTQKTKIIFTSFSKKRFYLRSLISAFVLEEGNVPISPFMNFDYNLSNLVKKNFIRIANNTLINKCDELWVFGEISDGVLIEIYLAQKYNKGVRYFTFSDKDSRFLEIKKSNVILEDVSPWMWQWTIKRKKLERWHPRLRFYKKYPLVYPAYSKRNFYWQMHISKYCFQKKMIPLNPFMLFKYFLGDTVEREFIYRANNNIVRISDEVWTFGEISDGVLAEIKLKKSQGGIVKHFKIASTNPVKFRKIPPKYVVFEEKKLKQYKSILF